MECYPLGRGDARPGFCWARTGNEPTAELYTLVRAAITDKRALQCRYESPSKKSAGDSEPFRFDPYGLYFGQRAWYAIGKHHGHNDVRTLKLSRFVACKSSDTPYFIPDDFSLDKYFGQAWRMIPAGKLHDIQLHLSNIPTDTMSSVASGIPPST